MDSATELRLLNLLSQMAEYKASDLHISVGSVPALRIAGQISVLNGEALVTEDFVTALIGGLLSEEQRAQLEKDKQLVFAANIKSKARYKIHAFYQAGFPSLTLRALPVQLRPLSALTLPVEATQLTQLTSGLVLVTGHFGSGKSTFIWSWIEQLNQTERKHIVTIEDPIEVQFNDLECVIEQRQLHTDISHVTDIVEFVAQEDIDIICLHLQPSKDVLDIAVELARMGKLVICETPFDSVSAALTALVDMYDADRRAIIQEALSETLVAAVGAKSVPQVSGGTIMAVEIIRSSDAVRSVIKQGAYEQLQNIAATSSGEGMRTQQQSIDELRSSGIVQ